MSLEVYYYLIFERYIYFVFHILCSSCRDCFYKKRKKSIFCLNYFYGIDGVNTFSLNGNNSPNFDKSMKFLKYILIYLFEQQSIKFYLKRTGYDKNLLSINFKRWSSFYHTLLLLFKHCIFKLMYVLLLTILIPTTWVYPQKKLRKRKKIK